jgi:hypothetical protein
MNISSTDVKPVYPSMDNVVDKGLLIPREVYFFEREDGTVINMEEKEASGFLKGRVAEIGVPFKRHKLIGVGDGKLFAKAIIEAKQIFKTTNSLAQAQERIRQGEKEELESARGKLKKPRDFDSTDPKGNLTNSYGIRI